jgi:uncharacterized surface protein with fasciclin (FAS1) repeats
MKYSKKYIKVLGLALATLTFNACSDDWDEHYKVQPQVSGVSLWQTISTDENLSNFKLVLEHCGYDKVLSSPQVFTVFAPTNDYFSEAQANAQKAIYDEDKLKGRKEKENRAIKEFVMNHIALYNHSVSTEFNDTIVMMNGKYLSLINKTVNGQSAGSIGDQSFLSSQQPHGNGILYMVDGQVDYFPNVLEQLDKVDGLDSIAAFFDRYNEYEFIPELSVPGGIVNGQTVYLDSVTQLENDLFGFVGLLDDEDSTYWMVAPTNDTWNTLVDEYTNYYNYDDKVAKRDSLQYLYSRLAIVRGTVFSATVNPEETLYDSVKSTNAMNYRSRYLQYGNYDTYYYQYVRPYDEGGIFSDVDIIQCSNGEVRKANTWNIDKSQTFSQMILTEGETRSALAYIDGSKEESTNPKTRTSMVAVRPGNPFYNKVSGNSFIEIAPTTGAVMPSATFYIRNVLSNMPYDIYAVMVPALAVDTLATTIQRLPTLARFTLRYHGQDGKEASKVVLQSKMETTPDVLDTLLLGTNITIPTCSYGVDEPQVTLEVENRVGTSQNNRTHQRTMRLDAIIFKPHVGEEIVID